MNYPDITAKDVMHVVFKGKYTILVFLFLLPALAFLACFLISSTYSASTEVIVMQLGESIPLEPTGAASPMNITDILNTEKNIITSREVIQRTYDRLNIKGEGEEEETEESGLAAFISETVSAITSTLKAVDLMEEVSPYEAAIADLLENITITANSDSNVLQIEVKRETPEEAAEIANILTDEYIKYHLEVYRGSGESAFFKDQAEQILKEINGIEEQILSYKERYKIVSFSDQQKSILSELFKLRESLNTLKREIITSEISLRSTEALVASGDDIIIPSEKINSDPIVQSLLSGICNLSTEINELTEKYSNESERVRVAKAKLEETKKLLRCEVSKNIDLQRAVLESLIKERDEIEKMIASYESELGVMPERELTLERLERRLKESMDVYATVQIKAREARISEETDERAVSLRLISSAYAPSKADPPNKLQIMLFSPLLGVLLGFVFIFVRDFFDRSIKRNSDVERILDQKVLSAIPKLRKPLGKLILNPLTDQPEVVEYYKKIKTALALDPLEHKGKSILITSSIQQEGVTTTAVNLARILMGYHSEEQPASQVILVELNAERPAFTRLFKTDEGQGLLELLRDEIQLEDAVKRLRPHSPDILPMGETRKDGTPFLDTERVLMVLETLKILYRYVVIDAAPVSFLSDTVEIAAKADRTIFVVRAESTGRDVIKYCLKRMADKKAKVHGVVLNRCLRRIPGFIYKRI
ncbi:MAG: polysaccharide biosynthesis tyrosine autokinase [Planctomycetes bacterium]|nr:polysaccharide biosynthesis tyrosine autokinase [Planctomycetota bacterium]